MADSSQHQLDPDDAKIIKEYIDFGLNHGTKRRTAGREANPTNITNALKALRAGAQQRRARTIENVLGPMGETACVLASIGLEKPAADRLEELKSAAARKDTEQVAGILIGMGKGFADALNGYFDQPPESENKPEENRSMAFSAGDAQAREEEIDPLDAEDIRAFVIDASKDRTNPGIVGIQAGVLAALARFGWKHRTPERPFSLRMLGDPAEQEEEAGSWAKMFRDAPDTSLTYRQHLESTVEAFGVFCLILRISKM
jgi:hypothetical protein